MGEKNMGEVRKGKMRMGEKTADRSCSSFSAALKVYSRQVLKDPTVSHSRHSRTEVFPSDLWG